MNFFEKIISTIDYYSSNGIDLTFVDKETSKNRLDICKSCEFYNNLLGQCKKCGCFMPFKTKLMYDPIESGKIQNKELTKCADVRVEVFLNQKSFGIFANHKEASNFIVSSNLDGADIKYFKKW